MALGAVLAALVAGTGRAAGAAPPTLSGPTPAVAAPDFATEAFSDPWDYSNAEDLLTDGNGPTLNVSDLRFSGGRLSWQGTGSAYISPLLMSGPRSLPTLREGVRYPIDASRYTRVSMRIYSGVRDNPVVWWFSCREFSGACSGAEGFSLSPGWNLIDMELRGGALGLPQSWSGSILGLRIATSKTTRYELDWLRLYRPGTRHTVTWSGGGTLHWDADADPSNNTAGEPGWGVVPGQGAGSAQFPSDAFPPGTYRFYTTPGEYSAPLVIDAPPLPVVLDPDEAGGDDYATVALGNPWDFAGPSDVTTIGNAGSVSWSGGMLHATNAPPEQNDPYVRMRLGPGGIDPSRYHRLTVTMSYDGAFNLADEPGGGSHGRFIYWRQDTGDWRFHDSKPIVTWTDRDTYTIDLAAFGSELNDLDNTERPGWTGSPITYFRWDPNEDRGQRRWRIDEIRLAADDETTGGVFDVRWRDDAHRAGTTVRWFADRDRSGFDGTPISGTLVQQAGENTFRWDASDHLPGTYWLHVEVDNGTSTSRAYATGPLRVSPRLAGPGRVETAVELSRSAHPGGAPAAVVAYARDFPDALAAAPLAAAADGPVLLNERDALHPAVADEIRRLGATTVYLIGGEAAQARQVEDDLAALPGVTVQRVAGGSRYATAAATARTAVDLWRAAGHTDAGDEVLIATGTGFADALAAGPLAIHGRRPLLLVTHGSAPPETIGAIADFGATQVTAIGGTAAVSDAALAEAAGTARTDRIWGPGRYDTARAVAAAAVAAGADPDVLLVANGEGFADALGAGPAVAARGGALLLSPRSTSASQVTDTVAARRGTLTWLRVAGGAVALSDAVVDAILEAAGLS